MTAQDVFFAMLKKQVAPALRGLGFKGSGQVYVWPSDEFWALLGFQRSRSSDAKELQFTMNLSVGSKTAWAEARVGRESWMPERPTPNIRCGPPMSEQRIGLLRPNHLDKWWRISADSDTKKLAQEVVENISDFAMPAILERVGPRPG
jgi:hypothetical protein